MNFEEFFGNYQCYKCTNLLATNSEPSMRLTTMKNTRFNANDLGRMFSTQTGSTDAAFIGLPKIRKDNEKKLQATFFKWLRVLLKDLFIVQEDKCTDHLLVMQNGAVSTVLKFKTEIDLDEDRDELIRYGAGLIRDTPSLQGLVLILTNGFKLYPMLISLECEGEKPAVFSDDSATTLCTMYVQLVMQIFSHLFVVRVGNLALFAKKVSNIFGNSCIACTLIALTLYSLFTAKGTM